MPATLFTYLRQTQRFLRDAKCELVDLQDLIDYVNQSRREIAMRSQCLRVLPPISGAVVSATVTAGGSGYTAPVGIITPPDSPSGFLPFPQGAQATANVTQIGGVIVSVDIQQGGSGYFMPQITISDPHGTGASATLATTLNNTLNQGQEKYDFKDVDLSMFPGILEIYFVRSVSIIYSNYRYSVPTYSFSVYQSMIRQYVASQYQYVPTFCAQFGQGSSGSLFMYPPPTQTYQLEWDCQCLPQDLIDDQSVEAIPDPWTDAVPYFSAHLAMIELQNWNSARALEDRFNDRMSRFGGYTRPGKISNPYGRW